jgi:hypothetical protein
MTVTIEKGQNFCCEVFVGLYAGDELSDIELAPGLWASRGLPVVPGEHWERWLGELAFRDIKTSLVLTATAGQTEPGIVINQTLKDRLNLVSIGLDLQGALSHQQGFVVSGSNDNGEPDARQFSRKRPSYASRNAKPLRVGISELKTALDLAAKLEKINVKGEDWRRVRRGIDVLRKAAEEPTLQDARLHEFVRCLESLILPPIGSSEKQFIHRAQTFAVACPAANEALHQIYSIRSLVEHLHNPIGTLPGNDQEAREELLYKRARQGEALARFAMRRVIEKPDLTAIFRTDDEIAAFWRKPDDEKVTLWGSRLDIHSIA